MSTLSIYSDINVAINSCSEAERVITARFRNPSRSASVIISNDAWQKVSDSVSDATYAALLHSVLETAAKSILSRFLENFSVFPSTMPAYHLNPDAILAEASGANSEWMSKEELESAWRASATRTAWVSDSRYATNAAFRKAVAHYETMILKLAGKTSQYKPSDLDLILAKLKETDLTTELGSFVCRRIETLRNKPAAPEVDTDLL